MEYHGFITKSLHDIPHQKSALQMLRPILVRAFGACFNTTDDLQ